MTLRSRIHKESHDASSPVSTLVVGFICNELVEHRPVDLALSIELRDLDGAAGDQVLNRFPRAAKIDGRFGDGEQAFGHARLCYSADYLLRYFDRQIGNELFGKHLPKTPTSSNPLNHRQRERFQSLACH